LRTAQPFDANRHRGASATVVGNIVHTGDHVSIAERV
jgi:hypothetical protein